MVLAWWQDWLISNGFELVALRFRIFLLGKWWPPLGCFVWGVLFFVGYVWCDSCCMFGISRLGYCTYHQVTAVSLVSVWQIDSEHWVHFSYGQLALLITFTSDNDIG